MPSAGKDPQFAEGEWLVFRLSFAERGLELGLPVVEGRRSPSLFWMPLTLRGPGEAPAAPPVDPAERFGIRFERLSRGEKNRRPWMEGFLFVPGLQVELPIGWWPSASLRSDDGYPIRLMTLEGDVRGRLDWLAASEIPDTTSAEWEVLPRPKVHRAAKAFRRADGALMYLSAEGSAFLFVPEDRSEETREAWKRMSDSVQLMRSERSGKSE